MRLTLTSWLLLLFTSLRLLPTNAQGVVLLDDFNRPNNDTVGNGWDEVESNGAASCAIVNNQLKLSNGAVAGRDYIVRSMASQYSSVLNANPSRLTWAFNVRQSRPNPSGFDSGNYGVAFVLAASSADFLASTTTGYAVVVGQAGQPDPFRLVRFAGGLGRNSNLTNVFITNTDYGTAYLTLRVTYFPNDNSWTLESTNTTAAFSDPATATDFQAIGTGTDGTYTGTGLPFLGCLWNHATARTEAALFDNFYVTAPCTLAAAPTRGPSAGAVSQLTSATANLAFAAGDGTARFVVLRAGQAPVGQPVAGAPYAANAAFGLGDSLAAGEYAVYNGTGTNVGLTNLQLGTTYYYAVYEANGTGCAASYLLGAPLTGSFAIPACVVAARPAVPASQGTAAALAAGSLTFSWQPGSGAGRLVVVRPGQPVAAAPTDTTGYSANARYAAGTALSSDEYVVYAGAGSGVTVTGLAVGQTYYAAVYEFNGSGCSAAYLTGSPATASAVVPSPPVASRYNFYRGNLHGHSAYSDGNKDASTSGASTPADDYALGRLAQQFDFMGISEHNHSQAGMQLANYAQGLQQADAANQDGSFVTLYGMEYGTISGGGHVIIYGYDKLIGWEAGNYDVYSPKSDYTTLFSIVAQQPGAIAYLAHPQLADYNGLFSSPLNSTTAKALVGSAMRSGPAFSTATDYSNPSSGTYEPRFKDALRQGYHVGPLMDHDSHYSVFGRSSYARLVLLAPALTRASLMDALQQRRFYAADDYNTEITFQIGSQPMGSVLTQAGVPTLTVDVADPDANDAVRSIALFAGVPGSGAAPTQLTSASGSATFTFTDPIPDQATYYYYAVITQVDGDKFWTAPIRYTRNDSLAGSLAETPTSFQAVLQNENEAVLRWTAPAGAPGAAFAVERSLDGRAFTEVGRVAASSGGQPRTYQLRDPNACTSPTYYRLRQAGSHQPPTYSAVVTLAPGTREKAQAHVYPNPSAGTAATRVALRGLTGEPVRVRVVDVLGRAVADQLITPVGYQADVPLSLPGNLPAGVYAVTLTSGAQVWTTRLVIEP